MQEIARRQALEGHQVTILATDAEELTALWDRRGKRLGPEVPTVHQGVRIRRLPVRPLPLGRVTFPALRWTTWLVGHLSTGGALALARFSPRVPALAEALREAEADLLFAWNITLEGLTAAVVREARRRGVPWIAVPLLHLGRPRFYTMRHQRALLKRASAVLTPTPGERAFLVEQGLSPGQVHVISPGVDPAEGAEADGQRFRRKYGLHGPLVVTLGALGYDKGTLHLLAAAQQLWRQGRTLTLALLGPQQESVRRALNRLPEPQRAACLAPGLVSEEEKWDALEAADVVALPSRTESFGLVFLEAWLRGKPVIGARAGAVADVIRHGVDGLLVPFGDVEGLAEALRTLLDDPVQARTMGQRGREKVLQTYTWAHQYDRLRTVMEAVMEGR